MLEEKQKGRSHRITVGVDKADDTNDFVAAARVSNVTAQGTKNEKRTPLEPRSQVDAASRRWDQLMPALAG